MTPVENDVERGVNEGLARLGLTVSEGVSHTLGRYAALLLQWNQKVNLTAITEPAEVAEKHLVDSLAVLPEVGAAQSLIDVGSGAGLPGVPLAVARPALQVAMVDAVAKKVGFVKHAIAQLQLFPRVRAVHGRAEDAARLGIEPAEVVLSRAFRDVERWLPLAAPFVAPGGRVIAMLGVCPPDEVLARQGEQIGFKLKSVRRYALPISGAPRAVAVFVPL